MTINLLPVSMPAVYTITHLPTGHFYIGSSKNLYDRIRSHRWRLSRGVHGNKRLQAIHTNWEDYDLHFTYCSSAAVALVEEQRLLDIHYGTPLCCNLSPSAKSNPMVNGGFVLSHTPEARLKMSLSSTGKVHTEETKKKIGNAHKGKTTPEATKRLMSLAALGKVKPNLYRPVEINGVSFESLKAAASELNMKPGDVRYRVASSLEKFSNWKYI